MADTDLPVESLNEALPHLRRPFSPAAVKWKIQTVYKSGRGGIVVAYIDARLVVERLNAVVGGEWYPIYRPVEGGLECELVVLGTPRPDVGMASGPLAPKALRSDALKRAAVLFGVGVSVYALPQMFMDVGGGRDKLGTMEVFRKAENKKVQVPKLTDENLDWLAEWYTDWLDRVGVDAFGAPLDHGDIYGAQGMDDEGAPTDLPELPEVESEEARTAREQALERTRAVAKEAARG